ncbi:hypothetical protein GF312_13765 [Candidatus Poribacteria bacterium]|nr:hypothetical protein [Candidatus Poribacteria bacterium]
MLADLEHKQWETWSKSIAEELRQIRQDLVGRNLHMSLDSARKGIDKMLDRWGENWKPYEKLNEKTKEKDREWARKVIDVYDVYLQS